MNELAIFRKMVRKQKENLTDEQILTAQPFTEHLTSMARCLCDAWRYRGKAINISVTKSAPFVACTDCGRNIAINVGHKIMSDMDMIHKAIFAIGLNLHECGHILFTNSKKEKEILKRMVNDGYLAPDCDAVNDFLQRANTSLRNQLASLFAYTSNCIEDGHIEYRLIKRFPNWADYLQLCRDVQLEMAMQEPVSAMIQKGLSTRDILFNILLIYAKYHVENYGEDDLGEEPVILFQNIEPLVDMAVAEEDSVERLQLICECFNAIFLALTSKNNSSNQSGNGDDEEENGQGQQQQQGQSQGNGEEESSEESNSEESENASSSTASDDESDEEDDGNGESGNGNSSATSDEDGEENNSSSAGNQSSSASDGSEEENQSPSGTQGTSSAGGTQSASQNTTVQGGEQEKLSDEEIEELINRLVKNNESVGSDNTQDNEDALAGNKVVNEESIEEEDDSMKGNGFSPESLSNLLKNATEQVAEEEAMKEQEEQAMSKLRVLNSNLDTGNYHRGVDVKLTKEASKKACSYDADMDELKPILRKLLGEFKKVIQDVQNGGKMNGLYFGRKLTQPYRTDFKRFSKYVAPEKIPDLAVCLYVDLSGSMQGRKEVAARKLAMLLYMFCKELGVDIAIYGHHAYNRRVGIVQYCAFGSNSKHDLEHISNLHSYNACNRDGYGLRLCAEELAKQQADKKLLFVISDGTPNDDGYDIRNATLDIHETLKKYQRRGVRFITAGLLQDAPEIKKIYNEGLSPQIAAKFLDISDLAVMPKLFTSIIKKEIVR